MDGAGRPVELEMYGRVAVLRMKRGQNRINPELCRLLHEKLDEVEANADATALVTTGEAKFYSNGLDLQWIASDGDAARDILDETFTRLVNRIMTFPMPTIAAVNGHAFAGGGMLALAHDVRVMNAKRGWFCMNEVHIGLQFTPFMLDYLRFKLNAVQFHRVAVLGLRYDAQQAVAAGIVESAHPPEELVPSAVRFAEATTAEKPYDRKTLRQMKELVYRNRVRQPQLSKL